MEQLALSDAIANLRQELSRAMEEGAGRALQFDVASIELELKLALSVSAGAKAEAKWWVVSFGGDVKGEHKSDHTIKLFLTPKNCGEPLRINSKKPVNLPSQ